MKTYNEIVDNLEVVENEVKGIPNSISNAIAECKAYTDTKFSAGLKREIVETLPTENIDPNVIYMVLDSDSTQQGNVYNEYLYINSSWELIGNTATSSSALYRHNVRLRIRDGNVTTFEVRFIYYSSFSTTATTYTQLINELENIGASQDTSNTLSCNGFEYDTTNSKISKNIYGILALSGSYKIIFYYCNENGFNEVQLGSTGFTVTESAYRII